MAFTKIPYPIAHAFKRAYASPLITNPALCEKILDKVKLEKHYEAGTKILDLYSGNGCFSAAVYNRVQPVQHTIMEDRKEFYDFLTNDYLPTLPEAHNITIEKRDPFVWKHYLDITEYSKTFVPEYQTRDQIHTKFLMTGSVHNEGLLMQWLNCLGNQNWMQRFGNVKMLIWVPIESAVKIMAQPKGSLRAKCSLVRETFSDTRLVAVVNHPSFVSKLSPIILENHDTVLCDPEDFSRGGKVALLEINPKDHNIDTYAWEYVVKQLMGSKSKPLEECLNFLGPAASEYFDAKLPKGLIKKVPKELTSSEFLTLYEVFQAWPFKPSSLVDSLDATREI